MSHEGKQLLRSTLTPFALGVAALGVPCLIDSMREYQNNDWGMLGFIMFFVLLISIVILVLAIVMSAWDIQKIRKSDAGIFKWKTSLFFHRHPILGFFVLFFRHLLCAILGFLIVLAITLVIPVKKDGNRMNQQNQPSNAR